MAGLDGEGGRWDEFDIAAEAFQEMVEEQKESLKGVLEEEVMQLNQVSKSSAKQHSKGFPYDTDALRSSTFITSGRPSAIGCSPQV